MTVPSDSDTDRHEALFRGPICKQHDFLVLITMLSLSSSISRVLVKASRPHTEGDTSRMSSAYRMTQILGAERHFIVKSSKYRANRYGDRTEPCLTPKQRFCSVKLRSLGNVCWSLLKCVQRDSAINESTVQFLLFAWSTLFPHSSKNSPHASDLSYGNLYQCGLLLARGALKLSHRDCRILCRPSVTSTTRIVTRLLTFCRLKASCSDGRASSVISQNHGRPCVPLRVTQIPTLYNSIRT